MKSWLDRNFGLENLRVLAFIVFFQFALPITCLVCCPGHPAPDNGDVPEWTQDHLEYGGGVFPTSSSSASSRN